MSRRAPLELAALRRRLAAGDGRGWRSLDAIADTPEFRRFVAAEFPAAAHLAGGPDRRQFLRLMGASLALAGLAGCDDEDGRDHEVPFVRNPDRMPMSAPLHYASVALLDGFANGAIVTTRDGRPIKMEGNPEHPWSRGGTDTFLQASVLDLYDPMRSQSVRYLDRISSWQAFRGAMLGKFAALRAKGGQGLRVLIGPVTSPALLAQLDAIRRDFPQAQVHAYSAAGRDAAYAGAQLAFGRRLETRWRFERARAVVSLDGDFLDPGPGQVGLSRDWIGARRTAQGGLLALHHAGSVPNLTSAKADHHLAVPPRDLPALAQSLLAGEQPGGDEPRARWLRRAGAAVREARGNAIVLAGTYAAPELHAAVHRLNVALGNAGETVFHTDAVLPEFATLATLTEAMSRGEVDTLLMLGINPVYDAPGSLGFTEALGRVPLKLHAGTHVDETAVHADWHLPLAHPLESWGDARSLDGTVGLMQPTVAPLYAGRSPAEILSTLFDDAPRGGLELLRGHWQERKGGDFAAAWERALRDGFWADSALPPVPATPREAPPPAAPAPAGLEVVFRPDPTVWDGSVANNGWLQELPKPLTKLVWENAVAVGPTLAEREKLAQGDVVSVEAGGRKVEGPVWILPGQADGTVQLALGYGRRASGLLCDRIGYDANVLRDAAAPWLLAGATLRKTGRSARLATTQNLGTMEGHDFVRVQREGALPVGDDPQAPAAPSFVAELPREGRAWAMAIDLDACIGCNACVTACQSENNIAVVGREEVMLGRAMHWLRVDRYYAGNELDDPDTHFQPVPCMHCENAPCEVGCPVEATLHDREGLNLMVYNRCIGTRACSGYCPYKVRRFNYLDYSAGAAPSVQAQRNPDVTVRARGVMEKCTYCVQRIANARIDADKANAPIPDGTVQTACQGACPTRAITFGDLSDPNSQVVAARRDPRHYALLGELNLRPRTTYLAERAPAPEAEG